MNYLKFRLTRIFIFRPRSHDVIHLTVSGGGTEIMEFGERASFERPVVEKSIDLLRVLFLWVRSATLEFLVRSRGMLTERTYWVFMNKMQTKEKIDYPIHCKNYYQFFYYYYFFLGN